MLIKKLYSNKIFEKLFPTLNYCLKKELRDCETVLDLGCGPDSPIQYISNIKHSVGVETWKPYLDLSKNKKIHNVYMDKKLQELDFKDKSFDVVLLIDVLEHLSKKDALDILEKASKWAKKKIIVTTPNGFLVQPSLDGNPYQKHLSGWDVIFMKKLGFKVYGLAGLKFLRKEKDESASMNEDILVSIKYYPKMFWFIVAAFSQSFTYYYPKYSFSMFCVKYLSE